MLVKPEEYARLLKQEIQLIKLKETCQKKSTELKRLQNQNAYLQKQLFIARSNRKKGDDPEQNMQSIFENVMPRA